MTTSRYTLTRTWRIPKGWTRSETALEAIEIFQDEIDRLKQQGCRILKPLEVTDGDREITFKCVLRGPVGLEYNETQEHEVAA